MHDTQRTLSELHIYLMSKQIDEISVNVGHIVLLIATVLPTKSDSVAILCLKLLSKTQTCTLHLS